jgi:hypothetical protein
MSSVQIDVAEAIVTELNAHEFTQIFKATRQHGELDYELIDSEDLLVDVVPYSVKTTFADRGKLNYLVVTSICVRKKFPTSTQDADGGIPNSEVDPYYALVQEIHDYFHFQQPSHTGRKLTNVPEAALQEGTEILAPYAKYLREMNMFLGIIRLPYEVYRSSH